jgi:hypothetical protein
MMNPTELASLELKILGYVRQQRKPVPFRDLWNLFLIKPVLANWKPFQHVLEDMVKMDVLQRVN